MHFLCIALVQPSETLKGNKVTKYTQVRCKNDWEHLTFHVGDQQLDHEAHTVLHLRFPDGSEQAKVVFWREETRTYSDHGKLGDATSWVPYVEVLVYGLILYVRLDELAAHL